MTDDENDRLEAENAALRAIAQATIDNSSQLVGEPLGKWTCPFCFADAPETSLYDNPRPRIKHTEACVVTKARALLAKEAR